MPAALSNIHHLSFGTCLSLRPLGELAGLYGYFAWLLFANSVWKLWMLGIHCVQYTACHK